MSVRADRVDPIQSVDSASSGGVEAAWYPHPIAARALRTAVVVTPVAASVGVVFLLNLALPPSRSWEAFCAIAVADVAMALIVLLVVNKVAMRALPLATVLSLSLVFPDRAPKRFSIVLRANSTSRLRSRVLTSHDDESDVTAALEELLTYLAALSRHDRMTRGHCERVRAFVDLLASQMDLPKEDLERLRWAALFHDIGKLRVPRPILRKPGKPTSKEWDTLKRHPVDGGKIIKPLAPWLGQWADAVEQHHERFDGQGYPSGLVGTDISLGGRMLAVADAYEVMITSRPYKRPVRPEAARSELVRYAGQQFDPEIVRAFLGIAIGDLRKVMGPLGVLSEVPILATVPRAEALIEMAGRQTIGAVGTAAGAGVLVAAATLSPVHVASPSAPVTNPVARGTTAPQPRTGVDGNPTAASDAPSQAVTSAKINDGPASSGPVRPSGGSTTGGDGSSDLNTITDSAPVEEVQSATSTILHTDVPVLGTVGTDLSIPSSSGSAATNLESAPEDVISSAGETTEVTVSTAS
ncbi:MAG TPA: HD-GYP domain-containing protein, partial [Acidimicrobiales bacterium]|nr:HD-GYP domain-containing protein [Acidimicrobiales bacterium]